MSNQKQAIQILNSCNQVLDLEPEYQLTNQVLEDILQESIEASRLDSQNPQSYEIGAIISQRLGNLKMALSFSNHWIRNLEDNNYQDIQRAMFLQAAIKADLNKPHQALKLYDRIIQTQYFQQNPDENIHYWRALSNMMLENFSEASNDLSRVLMLNPNNEAAIYQRGKLYQLLEKPLDALDDYGILHDRYSNDLDILDKMLECAIDLQCEDTAHFCLDKMEIASPGSTAMMYNNELQN